jgi:P-type conjugative transfer ATPase TrbB
MADRAELLTLAGPILRTYLDDPSAIEILVNPNGTCFVERYGQGMQEETPPAHQDLDTFLAAIADCVQQEWREQCPSLHAALPEAGWRIQACRPPQAPGLTMALRKHPQQIYTLEDYAAKAILTEAQISVLRRLLATRARVLISGATGSAKTSLTNACLHALRETDERLALLEDDPELICTVRNAVLFRTRPGVTMAHLVMDALRYRPDRIIIGEVRDGAALAMCRAFETGHSGMGTVHAESAHGTLSRIEGLIQEVSTTPQSALIGSVIDAIVHMERYARTWRCTDIIAVEGYAHGAYITRALTGEDV